MILSRGMKNGVKALAVTGGIVASGLVIALAVLLAGCRLDVSGTAPLDGGADETGENATPCGVTEVLVEDDAGAGQCLQICANQLHCWSGCCLPVGPAAMDGPEAGAVITACMPESLCFGGDR